MTARLQGVRVCDCCRAADSPGWLVFFHDTAALTVMLASSWVRVGESLQRCDARLSTSLADGLCRCCSQLHPLKSVALMYLSAVRGSVDAQRGRNLIQLAGVRA
jgi:hypothetical protein